MSENLIAKLEALLAKGNDGPTLRLALAARYLEAGDSATAIQHAEVAVRLDPQYSAAWRALGQALAGAARTADALCAYELGIDVAVRRGDQQAAKEMRVFARRLRKPRV